MRDCGSICEPVFVDAMDFDEAAVDVDFWVDEGVEDDAALFVDYRDFADDIFVETCLCAKALVHFAVNSYEQ